MADFADKLRALMGSRSQSWLAEASGVPQTTISAYLSRTNRPSWAHVQALARALGVSCTELQDDEQPPLPPTPPIKKAGRPRKAKPAAPAAKAKRKR